MRNRTYFLKIAGFGNKSSRVSGRTVLRGFLFGAGLPFIDMKHEKHPEVFGPDQALDQFTDYFAEVGHTRSGIYNRLSEIYSLGFDHGVKAAKRKINKKIRKITDES